MSVEKPATVYRIRFTIESTEYQEYTVDYNKKAYTAHDTTVIELKREAGNLSQLVEFAKNALDLV